MSVSYIVAINGSLSFFLIEIFLNLNYVLWCRSRTSCNLLTFHVHNNIMNSHLLAVVEPRSMLKFDFRHLSLSLSLLPLSVYSSRKWLVDSISHATWLDFPPNQDQILILNKNKKCDVVVDSPLKRSRMSVEKWNKKNINAMSLFIEKRQWKFINIRERHLMSRTSTPPIVSVCRAHCDKRYCFILTLL